MGLPDQSATSSKTWLELSVEADHESVESVSELLSRHVYGNGVAVYEHYQQDPDGDNLETDPSQPVTVVGYIPLNAGSKDVVHEIEQGLWHLRQIGHVGPLMQIEKPEEDWENAWKEHFHVLRIGKRFVIRPSWRAYEPAPDDLVIDLDPGMAFGTGHHPTTELCVRWLEELPVEGKRVLDVGAGSGILSIAAGLLEASEIDAVEIDEVAARALKENLERNEMDSKVNVYVGDFGAGEGPIGQYDLVLANIISSVLLRLDAPIAKSVASDGTLVLSGVIDRHLDQVRHAYTAQGLRILGERQIGDWYALLLKPDE